MVPRAGIEPARPLRRGIFLPTTAFAAAIKDICGLDFLFTMLRKSHRLGGCRQVSTRSRILFGLRSGLPPSLQAEVSPNLTPFTVKFPITVLNTLSPLRLPISPPGQMTFFSLHPFRFVVPRTGSSSNYCLPQRHLGR